MVLACHSKGTSFTLLRLPRLGVGVVELALCECATGFLNDDLVVRLRLPRLGVGVVELALCECATGFLNDDLVVHCTLPPEVFFRFLILKPSRAVSLDRTASENQCTTLVCKHVR